MQELRAQIQVLFILVGAKIKIPRLNNLIYYISRHVIFGLVFNWEGRGRKYLTLTLPWQYLYFYN
jgi:hypothetical protein